MKEFITIYNDHAIASPAQKKKVVKGYRDFLETTSAKDVREITPQLCVDLYRRGAYARMEWQTEKHTFDGTRRMLRFIRSRAIAIDEITKALTYLDLLKSSESSTTIDPKPIEVDDWRKLYAKVVELDDPEDLAMILLCLNGAFYLGEVIRLEWSDVKNGAIVTNRDILWKETIDAINRIERINGHIFNSYQRAPLGETGAFRRFAELRDAAEVDVTPSQLRDGAYTAAVEANVNEQLTKILVDYRCEMADNYVKRNPKIVQYNPLPMPYMRSILGRWRRAFTTISHINSTNAQEIQRSHFFWI